MKKLNLYLALLFVFTIVLGCNREPNTDQKEVLQLQGESEHWKIDYLIRESKIGSKYTLQCIISPLDQKEVIYDISYDITSPGGVSHLSGTMTSMDKDGKTSILENDTTISPSISTNVLPPKGENIIITVKWNNTNEEKIILTP